MVVSCSPYDADHGGWGCGRGRGWGNGTPCAVEALWHWHWHCDIEAGLPDTVTLWHCDAPWTSLRKATPLDPSQHNTTLTSQLHWDHKKASTASQHRISHWTGLNTGLGWLLNTWKRLKKERRRKKEERKKERKKETSHHTTTSHIIRGIHRIIRIVLSHRVGLHVCILIFVYVSLIFVSSIGLPMHFIGTTFLHHHHQYHLKLAQQHLHLFRGLGCDENRKERRKEGKKEEGNNGKRENKMDMPEVDDLFLVLDLVQTPWRWLAGQSRTKCWHQQQKHTDQPSMGLVVAHCFFFFRREKTCSSALTQQQTSKADLSCMSGPTNQGRRERQCVNHSSSSMGFSSGSFASTSSHSSSKTWQRSKSRKETTTTEHLFGTIGAMRKNGSLDSKAVWLLCRSSCFSSEKTMIGINWSCLAKKKKLERNFVTVSSGRGKTLSCLLWNLHWTINICMGLKSVTEFQKGSWVRRICSLLVESPLFFCCFGFFCYSSLDLVWTTVGHCVLETLRHHFFAWHANHVSRKLPDKQTNMEVVLCVFVITIGGGRLCLSLWWEIAEEAGMACVCARCCELWSLRECRVFLIEK